MMQHDPPIDAALAAEARQMLRSIGWEPSHLQQIRVYMQMTPAARLAQMLRWRRFQLEMLRGQIRRDQPDLAPAALDALIQQRIARLKAAPYY
ncbi:MAG TPA: hypothetical protein VKY74_07555 [Chloroflexia bacterium]|nr:hypothetical protein [Chloroflexia bacterium]